MKKLKNIKDLRNNLISVYENLSSGQIGQNQAKESANVAGKIISSCKTQMEYNKITGNTDRKIKFLESDE